ncbi:MAG: gliding motility-associated C-terminal domain-containing protein [Flavobacteriales bacterium]|nr:gliding motility-associated C-terminal domain-containing protein [Flavobacteriales bacterium]
MKTPISLSKFGFNSLIRHMLLLLSMFAYYGASAQSPTCDIALINSTFTGAGYVPLAVQGQPCSMYFVNPNSQEAAQAQAAAATLGANLVVMNDAAENANVSAALDASAFNGQTIWIGYQRVGTGTTEFYASDGTTGPFIPNGTPSVYQNWAGGEPNNNGYQDYGLFGSCDYECEFGEQCVQIYPGGQWNDLQCNETSISVIEVNLCPEITVDVSANNVCAGTPITLTASTLLGSTPYQYLWSTAAASASITVTPQQSETFDVNVTDRYACSAQESVDLVILPGPTTTFTVDPSACIGEPVNITYTGNATAGATYNWNFGTGVVVSGAGQGPYQVAWPTSGSQTVTLDVTENCPATPESQNVTISPSPTADFTFTTVCEGNPTDFTNTSNGNGSVILGSAWVIEGDTIISTDASYTFPAAGSYTVTLGVLTLDSCYATVDQQVTVNPGPTATFNATDVTCFGACDGTAEAVINGGAQPVTVSWSNGAATASITALCPGQFTGTVSDANGCEIIGQVDIAEPAELTATVDVTETSCPGLNDGTATPVPSGGTPPYTFDWAGEDPNALSVGVYDLTVTDANGCTVVASYAVPDGLGLVFDFAITDNICYGGDDGQAVLTVSNGAAPYDIVWTDAFNQPLQADLASQGTSTITGLISSTYNVVVSDAIGCLNATTITITQPPVPLQIVLTPVDLNCNGSDDGQITATQNGLSPFSYELSDAFGNSVDQGTSAGAYTFQDLTTGIYFVDITDANGCVSTDAVELFEPDPLVVESTVTPISCFGGSDGVAQITQISGGTTPYAQTTWDDPNSQVGTTASDLGEGTVTATVTDAHGCEITETFTLVAPPEMILTPSYVTDTCGQGKGAAVVQAAFGTPPYTYLWKPDGVATATHFGLYAGDYEVVVTDANGCADSVYSSVADDLPYPEGAFEYRISGESFLDEEVQFINNSNGTIQWQWHFGDGEMSFEEDPVHRYDQSGDYLVQLLASNGYCNDTVYNYVNIDPLLTVYIPNAFTPGQNGATNDGNNDYFYPQGEGIEEDSYDMFIFDRWGKMVWQTGKWGKKWDGMHMESLKPVPNGTYVYQITFREFADLDRHVYTGVVHVIRD